MSWASIIAAAAEVVIALTAVNAASRKLSYTIQSKCLADQEAERIRRKNEVLQECFLAMEPPRSSEYDPWDDQG